MNSGDFVRVCVKRTRGCPDGDVASLGRARERRAELASAIETTERNLEEALRSLSMEGVYEDEPQAAAG